ncbi:MULTISPECIES: hypothetical protein [Rhodococcus]|uniref:Uncharacterized protein n=1 Tax=Rhodococcus opacus RKJ300 = JCM 13270 TaxID=1165867 RepID=I0WN44_RHOOP|nr:MULTISPECIES: hypothetical protein [Rhodococcus]EID77810.1 hypothetical protein W59_21853 [Rhodococcus opacus RKJ300 = JCM 13270]
MLDVLATAEALRDDAEAGDPAFTVIPVAVGPSVRTGHGLVLATIPLTEITVPRDVLVMPAVGVKTPDRIVDVVRGIPPSTGSRRVAGPAPPCRGVQRHVLPRRGRGARRIDRDDELVARAGVPSPLCPASTSTSGAPSSTTTG